LNEAYWAEQIALAASEGERVLGFAVHPSEVKGRLSFDDLSEDLLFLGIVALSTRPAPKRSTPSANVAPLASP
jgi:hypothetical protein